MANTITGRVLSVGQPLQVTGRDPSRPIIKRELLIDCTRHDPYTGERSQYENTPLLEFIGDACRDLDTLRQGDIVTVTFSVEGTRYRDKSTQQEKVFTRVRPYRVEKRQKPQQPAPPVQQPQSAPAYHPQSAPMAQAPQSQQGYDPFPPPPYNEDPF